MPISILTKIAAITKYIFYEVSKFLVPSSYYANRSGPTSVLDGGMDMR
jgi:hypothetical protein